MYAASTFPFSNCMACTGHLDFGIRFPDIYVVVVGREVTQLDGVVVGHHRIQVELHTSKAVGLSQASSSLDALCPI